MYVDESGDCGLNNSPTQYFILTGLVLHETSWASCFKQIYSFRKDLRNTYGLKIREEIHAHAFIKRPGALSRISLNNRLVIIRSYADMLASIPGMRIINVVVDKNKKPSSYDVFDVSWRCLIQRFENTIMNQNFPGHLHDKEHGIIFPDRTDDKKLTALLRKMTKYNPVPSSNFGSYRNLVLTRIAEDPNFRNSAQSLFIQSADVAAYMLQQYLSPNKLMKKKAGKNYFTRLDPVLCKVASKSNLYGIVTL